MYPHPCVRCSAKAFVACIECEQTLCSHCMRVTHAEFPLHFLIIINEDGSVTETNASDLGLDLNLGHSGSLCPYAASGESVLVDISLPEGKMQSIFVNFCYCSGTESHEDQLIDSGLCPDTTDGEPGHCFTRECVDWLESLNNGERYV
jgi:hypothetical protein